MHSHRLSSAVLRQRRGFTLVEMLLVLGIIAILAGFVLAAVAQARAASQVDTTKSLIARLNSRLLQKWDSYRFRRLPLDLNTAAVRKGLAADMATAANLSSATKQALRMEMLWELQRMELPDQWTDIDPWSISGMSLTGSAPPSSYRSLYAPSSSLPPLLSVVNSYQRIFKSRIGSTSFDPRNDDYQSCECLYLIMTVGLGEDSLSPEELAGNAVGDKDGDGFLEFQDAWGEPIRFIRWPSNLTSDLQPMHVEGGTQMRDPGADPDPLDYTKIFQPVRSSSDPHYSAPYYGFRLTPLIESGGSDQTFSRTYSAGQALNDDGAGTRWDPNTYALRVGGATYSIPRIRDPYNGQNGKQNAGDSAWQDNITNHRIGVK